MPDSDVSASEDGPERSFDEAQDGDEISLLDQALVLAENARLLIFGPLFAGSIVFDIAFLITPTFTAGTTILPRPEQQSRLGLFASQLGAL